MGEIMEIENKEKEGRGGCVGAGRLMGGNGDNRKRERERRERKFQTGFLILGCHQGKFL